MDTNLATAVVSASGSLIVAIVAILTNNKRIDDLSRRMDQRFDTMEKHLDQKIDNAFSHMELLLKLHEAEHHRD